MFIAMNRFRIRKGHEEEFEQIWANRDSHLKDVPGFLGFHLLRGGEADSYTLYASHSMWASRDAFEAWTRSQAFRDAHRNAGDHRHIYLESPELECFEAVQNE